ncbi:MAG: hypothetical protein JO217_01385 [Acidobacteriaceae bacterium]|nr:hypothetical protein [Acidobacteriaceae bacterium]MBV9441324.1 hypothetical protein [Acidobacteriaceae bacterium]
MKAVQSLDPAGVGAQNLRECLLLQLDSRDGLDSFAWKILHDYPKLLETSQLSQLAQEMARPMEQIQTAVNLIAHLSLAFASVRFY